MYAVEDQSGNLRRQDFAPPETQAGQPAHDLRDVQHSNPGAGEHDVMGHVVAHQQEVVVRHAHLPLRFGAYESSTLVSCRFGGPGDTGHALAGALLARWHEVGVEPQLQEQT